MADETKITLKMGLIASAVAALIVMIGSALWNQQGRIVILETNYNHVCSTMTEMKDMLQDIRTEQMKQYAKEKR